MTVIAMIDWLLHAASIVLLLLTLPGTIELALVTLGAMLPRPFEAFPSGKMRDVALAVIVPVYNEESGLPTILRSLLACDDPLPAEHIIVMACNTTDRSIAIAHEFGCSTLERTDPTRRGKGYGLEYAFRHLGSRGYDAYIVVDADTTVDPNFLNAYRRHFARGGKAGQCILRVAKPEESTRTRLLNIAFLAFTYLRPLARHRLGLSAGIFGNGFGVTANVVKRVPYHCYSIAEDLEYHTQLIKAGVRVEFLGETSVAADMRATAPGAKSQRERWEGGRFRVMVEQTPRLVREIVQRRRWELVEPLLELLLLPLAYHVIILVELLCVALLIGPYLLAIYATAALTLVVLHILQAMALGKVGADDWKALASVPGYVGWKLLNLGGIIKAASKATPWKRTERSQP